MEAFPHLSSVTHGSFAEWVDREWTREEEARQTDRTAEQRIRRRPSERKSRNEIVKCGTSFSTALEKKRKKRG